MFKKTLISLAVASSVGLTGCWSSGDEGANANPDYQITDTTIDTSIVRPIYNPNPIATEPAFPINADLILLLGASQSANFDFTGLSTGTTPADDAVNRLSGFSTSGAFTLKFDGSLNPASVQAGATVFVLPLNVAPAIADAPEALPNTNPTGINVEDPVDLASLPNFRADVVSVDGGSDNAIRIVPLEPLEDGQKYLVVATNDIVGANGKPIERSVQDVAIADGVLGNPALGTVKTLLQNIDALANGILANLIPENTPESALAYTFTTNADTEVLEAMMAPAAFGSALGQKIGFTAQLKAVRDNFPELNFSELTAKLADIAEKAALLAAGELDPATLTAAELAAITALANVQEKVTPETIGAAIQAEVGDTIHVPQPRPSFFYDTKSATELDTIAGLALQDETSPIVQAAQQVLVSQGAIALPYFQSLPGETGAGIVNGSWTGSTSLEAGLNEELSPGEEIFQFLRDIDGKLNVNGYFPFPEQNATTTVPVVVFHPVLDGTVAQPETCVNAATGEPNGVTMFQHGITVDRSVSMLPAIILAQQTCQVVVAIDQPLHGLAGESAGTVPGLQPLDAATLTATVQGFIDTQDLDAQTVGALTALINADYIGERHFGFTANESLQPVAADLANVSSGSLFINPLNMLNSRDNVRQSVVDLLNVAASLQTFNLQSAFALSGEDPGSAPVLSGAGTPEVPVNFVGHSLGGISGTTFSSLVNGDTTYPSAGDATRLVLANQALSAAGFSYPELNSVVLHNTGGQGTRLIENSPTISGQILNGLAAAGVTQGSSDFENFFYIFQSAVDATDPVNFAEELGASTSNLLVTEVVGDSTVPNEANVNPLGSAFSAPLAGTEPLMALLDIGLGGTSLANGDEGLRIVEQGVTAGDGSGGFTMPVATFFSGTNPCIEANHGTFVAPIAPNDQCPDGVANTIPAFSAMVTQTGAAISGATIPVNPAEIQATLGTSATLENALDQDQAQ